ncbi:MAG: hypothetical protein M3Y49_03160 [Actinomycetota bacterium]|nr:hypothetical protein [Actinomycetota bacterium]
MSTEHDGTMNEPAAPAGRPGRASADRKPKTSVAQAQQAAAVADLFQQPRAGQW